jgi:hypothetical protein
LKCVLATDDSFYIPGQNHRCSGFGAYRPPGELARYFSGNVCKSHLKYLSENYQTWINAFKQKNVPLDADRGQLKENAETDETIEKLTGKYLT